MLVKYDWVAWVTVLEPDESLFLLVVSWLWLLVLKEIFLGAGVVWLVLAPLLPYWAGTKNDEDLWGHLQTVSFMNWIHHVPL